MKLLEHEAKTLLQKAGIPIPAARLFSAENGELPNVPTVLKAQVLTGRRNKFGGIALVYDQHSVAAQLQSVFAANIDGHTPKSVLAEELLAIEREFYLHLSIDRDAQSIVLLAHKNGGVDIESHSTDEFFRLPITDNVDDTKTLQLAEYLELETHEFALGELANNLLNCMRQNDATLLEINPLVLTKEGKLVAADCKMELDNAAAFRHPDWNFYDTPASANFVTLNEQGTVATIANGAGLAMATVDAVTASGLVPANFLDIGGTATSDKILDCFRQITTLDNIKVIIINIFGGIVRCDEVARAIIDAQRQIPDLPKLAIRLSGNRESEARQLLAQYNLPLFDSLEAILEDIS